MKKIAVCSLAALLLFSSLPVCAEENDAALSGTWYGLDWTLENHVLTVSGTGDVVTESGGFNDSFTYPDWSTHADEIYEVVLKEGITGIEESAFAGYDHLRKITIPSTLTKLLPYAFYQDGELSEIVGLEHVTNFNFCCLTGTAYIAENPFVVCDGKLWYAECTELTVPDGVTEIMPYAFGNLTGDAFLPNLAENEPAPLIVTLPEGVEIIHENAFAFCAGLEAVNIPESVRIIGNHAFFNCANLGDVTLGENVEEIGDLAFFNCRSLHTLTVENPAVFFGTDTYGTVLDWYAALEAHRENYTDEQYAEVLAELQAHPTAMDETMTAFAIHFWDTRSYDDVEFLEDPADDPDSFYTISGALAGYAGSTAQTYAFEHRIPFSAIDGTPLPGDVTLDDTVDIIDVIVLNKYLLGTTALDDLARIAADYNRSGTIDETDSLGILRHIIKLE